MITYFGLQAISGGDGIFKGIELIKTADPDKFNSIAGPSQSVPFSTIFTGILLLNMFYWCTNQQIIQRTFGASSLAAGQKGVLLTGALKLLGPMYLVLPGIMAFYLFASSYLDMKPDVAYGQLVRFVLPPQLTGFFAAVMVGAILSSFNSALNATCTLFSLGVYKNIVNKEASEEQVVKSGKTFGWIMAIIAMSIAPLLAKTSSIFAYLQKMNGLYFIPIFAVVLVGMLSRRIPALAAKAALAVGITLLLIGYFVPMGTKTVESEYFVPVPQQQEEIAKGAVFVETVTGEAAPVKEGEAAAEPITYAKMKVTEEKTKTFAPDYMHEFHFLGAVFMLLVVMMVLIGVVKPRAEAWKQNYSGDVEMTPWKFAVPVGIVLIILVFAIYAAFADFSILSK
jgi:SSS family solute:Na+ symporter